MTNGINLFEMKFQTESESESEISPCKIPDHMEKEQQVQLRRRAKQVIEALLFASNEALSFNKLREIIETFYPIKPRTLRDIIEQLQEEYLSQGRTFRLEEVEAGFLLRSCEEFAPYIHMLFRHKKTEKLSHAAAEVLAIIAYRQPITRPQIDAIRGVDSTGTLMNLLERELIEPVGKLEAPGRPTLYSITKNFMQYFGLRDLKDLPPLNHISKRNLHE
jgi:segregation and condensation protein B